MVELNELEIEYQEIKLAEKNMSIRIYRNGLIRIEQFFRLPKIDYVQIDESGMIFVYPEKSI